MKECKEDWFVKKLYYSNQKYKHDIDDIAERIFWLEHKDNQEQTYSLDKIIKYEK